MNLAERILFLAQENRGDSILFLTQFSKDNTFITGMVKDSWAKFCRPKVKLQTIFYFHEYLGK